jgi:hypothetical protein
LGGGGLGAGSFGFGAGGFLGIIFLGLIFLGLGLATAWDLSLSCSLACAMTDDHTLSDMSLHSAS